MNHQTNKGQLEAVMAFSLAPVVEKITESGTDLREAELAVQELKKFLFICSQEPEKPWPMMSSEVDVAWHEAIVNTPLYFKLCQVLRMAYLHHLPINGFDEPEKIQANYADFLALYRHYFGEMPPGLWPDDIYQAGSTSWCCHVPASTVEEKEEDGKDNVAG